MPRAPTAHTSTAELPHTALRPRGAGLGSILHPLVANRPSGQAHISVLNALHKDLSQFRKDHTATLKRIRMTVVAHRDQDAAVQLSEIQGLNVAAVQKMGWTMIDWLTRAYGFLSEVMNFEPGASEKPGA